jgi:hypothetical protein
MASLGRWREVHGATGHDELIEQFHGKSALGSGKSCKTNKFHTEIARAKVFFLTLAIAF